MHPALNRNLFLVKEHVGMFKAANNFDIFDPESGQEILHCREEQLGFFTKMFRFTKYKNLTPFHVEIKTPEGQTLISVKRGVSFLKSNVEVYGEKENLLGRFQQKLFSLGGRFEVLDAQEMPVCRLQGKWTGWEFKFIKDEIELAMVSKKWSGLGKEMFTSADNYVLNINECVPKDDPRRALILAAVMCIDMVLKE